MMKRKSGLHKKKIYNSIMIVAIAAILLSAVLGAGYLRGWFDGGRMAAVKTGDGRMTTDVTVEGTKGITGIVRDGLSFTLKENTVLRDGDGIETRRGSMAVIVSGENTVYLDENSKAAISVEPTGEVSVELTEGGAFASISENFLMRLADVKIRTERAVFWVGAPYGSAGVHVFGDALAIDGREVKAGQSVSILQGKLSVAELSMQALNSFELTCTALTGKGDMLCFSEEEIDGLAARRKTAQQEELLAGMAGEDSLGNAKAGNTDADLNRSRPKSRYGSGKGAGISPSDGGTDSEGAESGGEKNPQDASETGGGKNPQDSSQNGGGKSLQSMSGNGGATNPQDTPGNGGGNSSQDVSENGGESGSISDREPTQGSETETSTNCCTVKIVCDTILNHMDWLAEGKDRYVPESGVILDTVALSFVEGETTFDVLKRACENAGILLEYAWTPVYNSYYVEGIGNLYEFDCGSLSGWVFEVNGWFPNYGTSSYTLTDGDTVIWHYTCEGLGKDVGGGM